MQSMILGCDLLREQVLRQKLADFYQNIHVKGAGMLEFDAINRSVQTGYESYIEPLRQWLLEIEASSKKSKNKNVSSK